MRGKWACALVGLLLLLGAGWFFKDWRERRFDALIVEAARRYALDPALVKAVIWRESRFNPRAVGRAGEIGLMQVGDLAAHEWADAERVSPFVHEHTRDPRTNIFVGTFYLAKLAKRYRRTDHPAAYALGDYNAGRTHVLRWNKGAAQTNSLAFLAQIDFPGTREYIRQILGRMECYRSLNQHGSGAPPR